MFWSLMPRNVHGIRPLACAEQPTVSVFEGVPGSVCFLLFLWVMFGVDKTMRDSTITRESSVVN